MVNSLPVNCLLNRQVEPARLSSPAKNLALTVPATCANFLAVTHPLQNLSRRERQIMDVLLGRGRATAAEVRQGMPNPPSYSAVRATLRILEDKGVVRHEEEGTRYVYLPAVSRDAARRSALLNLIDTFFGGSPADAAAALLGAPSAAYTKEELDRLSELVEKARKETDKSVRVITGTEKGISQMPRISMVWVRAPRPKPKARLKDSPKGKYRRPKTAQMSNWPAVNGTAKLIKRLKIMEVFSSLLKHYKN